MCVIYVKEVTEILLDRQKEKRIYSENTFILFTKSFVSSNQKNLPNLIIQGFLSCLT